MAEYDPRISKIFYYFEDETNIASGRTVGRKIGIVQEVLLRKYLEQDEASRRRMYLEQMLLGRSGASHKVEFSWYSVSSHELGVGDAIPGCDGATIVGIEEDAAAISIPPTERGLRVTAAKGTPRSGRMRTHLDVCGKDVRIVRASADSGVLLDVVDRDQLLVSLESKRVGAQRFSGSKKLGSGIQTIEKAKQCSLVAIDLDLAYNGNVKPLETTDTPKRLISCVALGNGVHWTEKDRAIMATYVDFTYLVKDDAIIRYAEYVKGLAIEAGQPFMPFFMDYFSGMTVAEADGFEVHDDDFEVITPADEQRTLLEVIGGHIRAVEGGT